jgi:hypothetical protein
MNRDSAIFVPPATPTPPLDRRVVAAALFLLIAGAGWIVHAVSWRQASLFVVGGVLGVALYHAAFGFTAAYRRFLVERRGDGIRAQMLMLAVAAALIHPLLGAGSIAGMPVSGAVAPVGVSVVVGSFLFGVGMQLGGGCASGTLFAAGGGNLRMILTLIFFVAGALLGAAHAPFWSRAPNAGPVSLIAEWGWGTALLVQCAAFALIAGVTVVLERRTHGSLAQRPQRTRLLRGPWPLALGAVVLALGNFAVLLLSGRPWGISGAFALWGAKAADAVGVDVSAWPAFASPKASAAIEATVLADPASVGDFGIIAGALLASGLAGRFAPTWRIPARSVLAAVLGGLLLGYGARIAFGCNIGAFFSGVASGSVHGWLWIACALAGNAAGVLLRPLFGLPRR